MFEEKFLRIKTGDRIRLLKPVQEGVIDLPLLTRGKIVDNYNQVEAKIWFNTDMNHWDNPIRKTLEVDKLKIGGLVIELPVKQFAVVFNYRDHRKIQIDSRKLVDFPFFFNAERLTIIPSNWMINNERGIEYLADDVIGLINENFADWVITNLKTRKVYKYEKENGEYPEQWERVYTDDSMKKYYEKRQEIELKFAQLTGLFYEFYGGMQFND